MNALLGLHISAAPLPFCSCVWAQQKKCGNKSRISHTQEGKNLRQQLTGSRTYVYCHLPPYIWKATTSKGEKNPFAESLGSEESTSSAGCWLSSQQWLIFLLCHPPSSLMEPVINSALYSSLMLFHSHFVEVVSLPWQKASHSHARLWVVVSDWWLVVLSVAETSFPQSSSCPCSAGGPGAHQRGGTDPGWCRDMGQHSTLKPEQSLQTQTHLHITAWGGRGRKRRNEEQK